VVQQIELQAELRASTGKGPGRQLRMKGRIPAVVYGMAQEPVSLSVNTRDLDQLIGRAGEHAIISLKVAERETVENVMLRDLQRDPIKDTLVHADFFRIDLNRPISVQVPIVGVGTAVGVKDGGLLERLVRTIVVRVLPLSKPNVIEVDVTNVRIGHSLHVRDLTPPPGVEFLSAAELALFTVLAPRKEEEEVAAAAVVAEEVAEPELITKGKEEEEGEEEEGGKKEKKEKEKEKKEKEKKEKKE